jgi:hypothetical protein
MIQKIIFVIAEMEDDKQDRFPFILVLKSKENVDLTS